jgi:MraZ protein
VFKGTYRHRLDGKGRIPIPAPFRRTLAALGSRTVVATLVDQCVAIYPESEWHRLEEQLRRLPAFQRQSKALVRHLASRAADCGLDSQGRILLPPALRAAASLAREAVVVGVIDRIEVWQPSAWQDFLRDSERLLDDVSLDIAWPMPGRIADGEPGPGSTGKP